MNYLLLTTSLIIIPHARHCYRDIGQRQNEQSRHKGLPAWSCMEKSNSSSPGLPMGTEQAPSSVVMPHSLQSLQSVLFAPASQPLQQCCPGLDSLFFLLSFAFLLPLQEESPMCSDLFCSHHCPHLPSSLPGNHSMPANQSVTYSNMVIRLMVHIVTMGCLLF
jgi:hypothetical protein